MKIKNFNLYLLFICISLCLIVAFHFVNLELNNIIINISCSILAASIMAFFIDNMNLKRENEEKNNFKKLYFDEVNNMLSLLLGKIIWFHKHKNDNYMNWNNDIQYFLNFHFNLYASSKTKPYSLSFEKAVEYLKDISENYTIENVSKMNEKEREMVFKMFKIISKDCFLILDKIDQFNNNKILLDNQNYIKQNEINELLNNMKFSSFIMKSREKDYQVAIKFIISSAIKLREIGNYDNEINVDIGRFYVDFNYLF